MQWCKEAGIAHSVFLEWTPEDRSKALAFLIEENSKCAMCGTASWEWENNPHAYEPIGVFCKGCYLKRVSDEGSENLPGTTMSLISTGSQEYARILSDQKRTADERTRKQRERQRSSER